MWFRDLYTCGNDNVQDSDYSEWNRIRVEHRDSFNAVGNVLTKINGGLILFYMYHVSNNLQ